MSFLLDRVIHVVLAPVVRTWASIVNDGLAGVPFPLDSPSVHAPGPSSDRVLLLGSGPAVGRGVSSHDLALPGALARALTARTRRGTDVNVISDSSLNIRNASNRLEEARLCRYDAIVLTLGANDALSFTSIRMWTHRLTELLADIEALAPKLHVFVAGIQPIRSIPGFDSALGGIADHQAELLNRASSELCAMKAHVTFIPLMALPKLSDERHRSPEGYAQWGRTLAEGIAPVLDSDLLVVSDSHVPEWPTHTGSSIARQCAVEDLTLGEDGMNQRLDHIVGVARRAFGTQIALFSVLDNDRQQHIARAGTSVTAIPLADSVCNIAIGYRHGLMIPDARQDPRFSDNPFVRGGLNFYAGYPVESPRGERIGTLCIFDTEPRAAEDVDLSLLREMALRIQRELWPPGNADASLREGHVPR